MTDKKNHEDLIRDLISQIREREIPFYSLAAKANNIGWYTFALLSIVLSAAASLIAALTPAEQLKDPIIRGLLITLPIIGATVTAVMRSFNFHERERNREIGLIEAERLLRKAESMFASATTEPEYKEAYLELTDKLAALSHDQHALDVATRKGVQTLSVVEPR
ncbi:hypothetical protein [Paraburkholderia domus]|uniref:hypothetical protein n=1 Tax=Paraburkholderia domus TaxID=2793075 RepID=UPI001B29094D|nr:hypothetical protein [Paraburkholderia domus]CAE6697349.1 hypothetical protein R75483_00664 [Paraburkholderia domus]